MSRFNVELYTSVRIKAAGIEASSPSAAVRLAIASTDFHAAIQQGRGEWDEGEVVAACVDPLLPNGEIDYDNSQNFAGDGRPLPLGKSQIEQAADRAELAQQFMTELLDSVESLTAIADEYGAQTLADLMYLQAAIVAGDYINHYPEVSSVDTVVEQLPSAKHWLTYIKDLEDATKQPGTKVALPEHLVRTEVIVMIPVSVPGSVSPAQICGTVHQLLLAGLGDAEATLDNEEGDLDGASFATSMTIDPPLTMAPRVLVVVSGGVADPVYDKGIDLEVFDWDNYKDDPQNTQAIPAHFADLAEGLGIPVEGQA